MSTRPEVLRWRDLIKTVSAETGVPAALLAAVIDVESQGQEDAVNPVSGAAGLMQVIPKHHSALIEQVLARFRLPAHITATHTEALKYSTVGVLVGALHLAWCIRSCGPEERGLSRFHSGSCDAGNRVDSIGTKTTYYVEKVMGLRPHYAAALAAERTTVTLTFRRVPHPPYIDKIVPKPAGSGQGHIVVPPRKNVGTCVHYWGGRAWTNPAWQSIYNLFSGERLWDALTDYSVQRDGSIVRLNDPRGTRSPYASGGNEGLAGDGPAFVRVLGVAAINARLVSIETEGAGEPMTPAQLESVAALVAYWHDQDDVPWDQFPLNPKYGVVTQMQHWELGKRACPGRGVRDQTDAYQDRTRAIMKQYQTASVQPPVVPPLKPPTPQVPYSAAKDQAFLRERFGTLPRYDATGKVIGSYPFDPTGMISNAWLQRCDAEDIWPPAVVWEVFEEDAPVKQRVVFESGWVLNDLGEKGGWTWAGREDA
jgi:hypothetical protein